MLSYSRNQDNIVKQLYSKQTNAAGRARGLVSILNQKWQDSVSCSLRHETQLTTGLGKARLIQLQKSPARWLPPL